MEEIPCLCCGTFFVPRNKKQQYCSVKLCQQTRKRKWQQKKLLNDPEYRENKRCSQKKWQSANPDYWKKYREKNPKKAERNRVLQRIRNKNKSLKSDVASALIAKMDASNVTIDSLSGAFWLVPEIAKMDAVKVYISAISMGYR
jgi:hypothetical protein